MESAQVVGILAAASFLPAIAFLLWVRAHERHNREPVAPVLGVFAYGATLGIAVALVLGVALDQAVGASLLFAAVVVAPFVEELAKGLGLGIARRHVDELEDGIVYGAAAGVGFAATETFLYGLVELNAGDAGTAVAVVVLRNVTSLLLHAGSSALLGYGYAAMRLRQGPVVQLAPYYLLAVGQHALYNFLVLRLSWVGFLAAVVLVVVVTTVLRRRIRHLDRTPAAVM